MNFRHFLSSILLVPIACTTAIASVAVVPFRVPARLEDAAQLVPLSDVHVDGWLGQRIQANATNRLLTVDTEPLLAGFKKKPGIHPWIGEHVGKWMHAATLAWAYTGDQRLRDKLDKTAAELIAAQEPDGYLGTYVPEKRFGLYPEADWDVWSHKYNLIGLLMYYQYTGNEAALTACRKIGDLLINTFGPGRKSILSAGTHVGMASTSVLEPIVRLYRFTGDDRYLDFAKYIVKSWDEPNGPRILDTLLTVKQVNKTANGKAYEMLSNLVGLCELARATGDRQYLDAVLNAWSDVASKRLYITGSASQGEHFHNDYDLPNNPKAAVAETCVTTTWAQLNLQLLRLTGQAKFGTELEKTLYNHLAAAQNPRGDDWCYFTPLEGTKDYKTDINCCHSSGPRGMALAPLTAYLKGRVGDADALLVDTFETSRASVQLDGKTVKIEQQSQFPAAGQSQLIIGSSAPAHFAVGIRTPEWGKPLEIRVNGGKITAQTNDGWAVVAARDWKLGDRITLRYSLEPRVVIGEHTNKGLRALEWGPFVLAYDAAYNPALPDISTLQFGKKGQAGLAKRSGQPLEVRYGVLSSKFEGTKQAIFVPFADAGSSKQAFKVWLPERL